MYAVYTLGNGVQLSGPPKQCNSTGARTGRARGAAAGSADMKANSGQSDEKVKGAPLIGDFGQGQGQRQGPSKKRITANFTIHWAEEAAGPYQQHNASILNWPVTPSRLPDPFSRLLLRWHAHPFIASTQLPFSRLDIGCLFFLGGVLLRSFH